MRLSDIFKGLGKPAQGSDTDDIEDEAYDDIYGAPEDPGPEAEPVAFEDSTAAVDSPVRKEPSVRPAPSEKVALKLLQPKSHTEATQIADKLKDGCIVLLDISSLSKEAALRLVDFLAGVTYVLGGEMIKTNKNTIVVSPAGVDISGFAQEESAAETEEAYGKGEQA